MAIIAENRFPKDNAFYAKPLLVELPDDILINGVAHDKLTLAPKFLRTLEYDVYEQNTMDLNKVWYGKYFGNFYSNSYTLDNGCNVASTAILDNDDPNVIYLTSKYGYVPFSGQHPYVYPRFMKVSNKNLYPQIEYKISAQVDAYWMVHQNSDDIFFLSRTRGGNSSPWTFNYFGKFDKMTLTAKAPKISVENGDGGLMLVTPNYIYAWGGNDSKLPGAQYGLHRFMIYDKTTDKMAVLVEDNDGQMLVNKKAFLTIPSQVFSGAPNYYYYIRQNETGYDLMRVTFVDGEPLATPTMCIVDYGDKTPISIVTKHTGDSVTVTARAYRLQSGGRNFMCFAVYETRDMSTTNNASLNDTRSENIYVYEINPDNPDMLTYRSTFKMGDDKIRSIIPLDDNYELVMLVNEYSGKIIRFSHANNEYIEIEALKVPPRSVGQDSIGRTWITDDQNRLSLFTPQIPTFISAKTEEESYDYAGIDIATNLEVYSLNYLSEYISIPIRITLTGMNMVFMDGTRERIVNSLDTGTLTIPIKIVGPGFARVVASAEV